MTEKQFKQEWVSDGVSITEKSVNVKLWATICTDVDLIAKTLNQYINTMNKLNDENQELKRFIEELEQTYEEKSKRCWMEDSE